ncbi:MAG: DUF4397 domain-containing protein [Acidobacteria bacterium]|jgi:hypothetical protein|nr:DUF4397 domain-containing protein [Acidobacteriota bacterium]
MTRSLRSLALSALAALAILFPATAIAADNTVYVVHGIPGAVVDVYVNGGLALEDYTFSTVVGPLALPPGTYTIEVFLANSDPTATEAVVRLDDAELAGGLNLSLVAALTPGGTPAILPFVNDVSPVQPNFGRLGLRHAADAPGFVINARGLGRVNFSNGSGIDQDVVARTYALPFALFNGGSGMPAMGPEFLTVKSGTYTIGYVVGSAPQGNLSLVTQEIPLETMKGARGRR